MEKYLLPKQQQIDAEPSLGRFLLYRQSEFLFLKFTFLMSGPVLHAGRGCLQASVATNAVSRRLERFCLQPRSNIASVSRCCETGVPQSLQRQCDCCGDRRRPGLLARPPMIASCGSAGLPYTCLAPPAIVPSVVTLRPPLHKIRCIR